jgi:hypothetical protein
VQSSEKSRNNKNHKWWHKPSWIRQTPWNITIVVE